MEQPYFDQLVRINAALFELCNRLNEKRDVDTSSKLIPIVDKLTHLLIEISEKHSLVHPS